MSRPDSRSRGRALAAGAVALAAAWVAALPSGTTYAAWSDFATVPGTVGAGVWLTDGDPPLPDQCLGMVFDRIIIGTNKDDTLDGTPGNDLIFGLQGKDVLRGLGGQDCLVGNNGKDQLFGEDGDDVLVGGNAKDTLDGGNDNDICDGGRGKNTLVNCASSTTTATPLFTTESLTTETESVLVAASPEPTDAPKIDLAPETDSGASVEDPPEAPLVEPATVEVDDPVVQEPEDVAPAEAPVDDSADEVQP